MLANGRLNVQFKANRAPASEEMWISQDEPVGIARGFRRRRTYKLLELA